MHLFPNPTSKVEFVTQVLVQVYERVDGRMT